MSIEQLLSKIKTEKDPNGDQKYLIADVRLSFIDNSKMAGSAIPFKVTLFDRLGRAESFDFSASNDMAAQLYFFK